MTDLIFKLRFKFYLWRHVPGMRLIDALRYPAYPDASSANAFEAARDEMSYMNEG